MRQAVSTSALVALLLPTMLAQRPGPPEIQMSARPWVLPPVLLTAQTNLVEASVVVRGRDDQPIAGLSRAQFQILDDGEPRAITSFLVTTGPPPPRRVRGGWSAAPLPPPVAAEAQGSSVPAPRATALFFDDINTAPGDLGHARIAALRFVREAMQPGDQVGIFTASGGEMLDFTRDKSRLVTAVAAIRIHPRAGNREFACPHITPYEAYMIAVDHDLQTLQAVSEETDAICGRGAGNALARHPGPGLLEAFGSPLFEEAQIVWDQVQAATDDTLAAIRATVQALAGQPGPRTLLVASGGFMSGEYATSMAQDAVVADALHAGVVISALDAKGLYAEAPGLGISQTSAGPLPLDAYLFEETRRMDMHQAQIASMAYLAASTGGLVFENSNDLFLGFYQLGLAPEVSYSLGFSPGVMPHDGKYHKLKLELTGVKNATLEYRPGYFDPPPDTAPTNIDQRIAEAMRSTAVEVGGPGALDAKLAAWRDSAGVQAEAHVNITGLSFLAVAGRREEKLFLVVGLFDSQGKFVSGKLGEMALALTPDTYRRLAQQGLDMNLTIAASPGARYRVRIVALERNHGTLCAGNLQLSGQ